MWRSSKTRSVAVDSGGLVGMAQNISLAMSRGSSWTPVGVIAPYGKGDGENCAPT
jgi:hypothetical protein